MHCFFTLLDLVPASAAGLDFVVEAVDRALARHELDAVVVGAGLRRPLRAAPAARARPARARLRGGRRRRRHLVLEPLPGRALRHREHGLLVLVLARSSSRSGTGPSAIPPSPRSCATSSTSPTASTCAATSSCDTRSWPRAIDEARGRWTVRTERRRRVVGALLRHGGRLPLGAAAARTSTGSTTSRASAYHTGRWPHEGVDFAGKRVGVIGTGSSGIQAIPRSPSRPSTSRLPAHAELQHARRATGRSTGRSARVKANYRERRQRARESLSGVPGSHPRAAPGVGARRWTPEERRARVRGGAGSSGGIGVVALAFNDLRHEREANETAADFVRDKIREIVQDPARRRALAPTRLSVRHQAHLRRHRLLRDLQPRQRHARRRRARRRSRRSPRAGSQTAGAEYEVDVHRLRHRLRRDDRRAARASTSAAATASRCARSGRAGRAPTSGW